MEGPIVAGETRECCKVPENLELKPDHPDAGTDRIVRVCRICESRHIEFSVDRGVLGIAGKNLGMRGGPMILTARVLSVDEGVYTIVGANGDLMYATLPR